MGTLTITRHIRHIFRHPEGSWDAQVGLEKSNPSQGFQKLFPQRASWHHSDSFSRWLRNQIKNAASTHLFRRDSQPSRRQTLTVTLYLYKGHPRGHLNTVYEVQVESLSDLDFLKQSTSISELIRSTLTALLPRKAATRARAARSRYGSNQRSFNCVKVML